jgi:hypothetical protein
MAGKRAAPYDLECARAPKQSNTYDDGPLRLAAAFQVLCATWAVRAGELDGTWSFWRPNMPLWTIDEIMLTLSAEQMEQQMRLINYDLQLRAVRASDPSNLA